MKTKASLLLRCAVTAVVFTLAAPWVVAGDYGLPEADPESVGMSAEKLAEIPKKLQPFIDNGQVPGFISVVARDGKVVHFDTQGMMDVERRKPMRPDTIFRMASMTKPITGVAVMILVDEGKIDLQDPLSKYIPEFADLQVLVENEDGTTKTVPADKPITLWHLMTHTSGLAYPWPTYGPVARMYIERGLTAEALYTMSAEEGAKRVASVPLFRHPGVEFNYGFSMDMLGRVVEVVTGRRFGDFLEERIFGPLGMKDAGFYVPADKVDRLAANYGPHDGKMRLIDDPATSRLLKVPSMDSPGGGLVSTATDYLRFAQMLVNGGELDGVRILSEDAVNEMTTEQLGPEYGDIPLASLVSHASVIPLWKTPAIGVGFGYGGAVVKEGYGQTQRGSAGQYSWGGGASTAFWIDREQHLVSLVLTQLSPGVTYAERTIMSTGTNDAIVKKYPPSNTD